jgi:putative transposase
MARKLRLQFPGAIYHVMSRGDRREDIFRDDVDRDSFLQTLADACAKTGWQVHAFCLMPNHFHLVVETPQPNLVAGMKWFLGTYTARFNRRHRLSGHVFAGRYKSLLVGGEGGYLRTVCDYVHLNPVRAKLIAPESPLRTYRWSSFPLHLAALETRPSWLRGDRLFGELGIQSLGEAGRAEFEQRTEARRAESNEEFDRVRRGWYFGGEQFRSELLAKVEGEARGHHFGAEIHEASEAKATRILDEELRRAVWSEAELKLRQKGDPQKLQIARRLRTETTMTLQWIANRLHMGTKTHLSHLLYWHQRAGSENQSVARAKASAKSPSKTKHAVAPARSRRSDAGPEREQSPASPLAKSESNSRTAIESQPLDIPLTDPESVGGFDTSFD